MDNFILDIPCYRANAYMASQLIILRGKHEGVFDAYVSLAAWVVLGGLSLLQVVRVGSPLNYVVWFGAVYAIVIFHGGLIVILLLQALQAGALGHFVRIDVRGYFVCAVLVDNAERGDHLLERIGVQRVDTLLPW